MRLRRIKFKIDYLEFKKFEFEFNLKYFSTDIIYFVDQYFIN
jgi:hypothetical protein